MARAQAHGAPPAPVEPDRHLLSRLWERATDPEQVLSSPAEDGWQAMTWAQLATRVRGVAAGLVADGLRPGDRVALMGAPSANWTVADLGILAAAGVTVPIYETSSAEQCGQILSGSGARLALIDADDELGARIESARRQAPDLDAVHTLTDGVAELAGRAGGGDHAEVEHRGAALAGQDLATIVYTSGTTGAPKGCELTHHHLVWTARQVATAFRGVLSREDSTLLFLPLAHALARLLQFLCLEAGVCLGYARSRATVAEDLRGFRPTLLLGVPRLFDKLYQSARDQTSGVGRWVFDAATETGRRWSSTSHPGLALRGQHAVADRLVYRRLREALGGRVRYCVAGGAPLEPALAHFFDAAGIPILEGYGVTETTAPAAMNTPDAARIGTVGRPVPGVTIAIADDGEVLVKGPNVFRGYHGDEQATKEAFTGDGWLRTGDLGELDNDGFLRITGRSKELLVTAAGKNVSPAPLERRLGAERLVAQAIVVGDDRPFVGALIALDDEELAAFANEHGLGGASPGELRDHPTVRAELQRGVDRANEGVSRAESIRAFVVLERGLAEEHGELTPTMKPRREVVADHFADEIERLYGASETAEQQAASHPPER
jgi:long-chain acyl-CoA synthetase